MWALMLKTGWNLKVLFDLSPFGLCVCMCLRVFVAISDFEQKWCVLQTCGWYSHKIKIFLFVLLFFGGKQ